MLSNFLKQRFLDAHYRFSIFLRFQRLSDLFNWIYYLTFVTIITEEGRARGGGGVTKKIAGLRRPYNNYVLRARGREGRTHTPIPAAVLRATPPPPPPFILQFTMNRSLVIQWYMVPLFDHLVMPIKASFCFEGHQIKIIPCTAI